MQELRGITISDEFDFMEINSQIEEALHTIINTNQNVLIIGNAGSGKSETVKICQSIRDDRSMNTVYLAPTGVAAVRIGGQTIHSFFHFKPELLTEKDSGFVSPSLESILKQVDRIVIDEISMVRVEVFEAIHRMLKTIRFSDEPFGGVQMVCIGDLYQLPPIVKSGGEKEYLSDIYDGFYFFNSYAFKNGNFKTIEYKKSYRQNDLEFIGALNRIRKGQQSEEDLKFINKSISPLRLYEKVNDDFIYLSPFNRTVEARNEEKLSQLPGEVHYFQAVKKGKVNMKNFMFPETLSLKIGAKVMMLINDDCFVNGSLGVVEGFVEDSDSGKTLIEVKLFNGFRVLVGKAGQQEMQYTYRNGEIEKDIKGSIEQYPMKLAYAVTIHKSQSATYEKAYLDIPKSFAAGQTYVALSRLTSSEGLGLKYPLSHEHIIVDKEVEKFIEDNDFEKKENQECLQRS